MRLFDRERADEMLLAGIPYTQIIAELGCSRSALSFRRQRLGLVKKPYGTPFDWKPIQNFYDNGHTIKECLAEFGVSSTAIFQARKRGDFTPRMKDAVVRDMAAYMFARREQRRVEAIASLGGKCSGCGTTQGLQFDHIEDLRQGDHSRVISCMLAHGDKRFFSELSKCQLLCHPCHVKKTRIDLGFKGGKDVHGSLRCYQSGCRCPECRVMNRDSQRQRRASLTDGIGQDRLDV